MSLKFSIVTPSLNQGMFIKDTIDSVLKQNYDNYEHIVMDGGSVDNTEDIVKNYPGVKYIREEDTGPADAINKGFAMSTGEIFGWINSDDYYEKNIFEGINSIFESNPEIGMVIGNLTVINQEGKILLKEKTYPYNRDYLIHVNADVIRQPCTFFRRDLFYKAGKLNINLKYVFDYDLFIRMLGFTEVMYTDQYYAVYREHDNTLTRLNLRKQSSEIRKVSAKYGGKLTDQIFITYLKKNLFPYKFTFEKPKKD